MTDRSIMFSAPMVRALLDGRKTQTRRVLKPRGKRPSLFEPGQWADSYVLDPGNAEWVARDLPCAPGDRLWVREAWRTLQTWDGDAPANIDPDWAAHSVDYVATPSPVVQWGRNRAGIHMPRWASRLTLLVTGVRVQRLQDISEADAVAEGFDDRYLHRTVEPQSWYQVLWNSLHGPDAWDANPWVAAISFDVVRANIDEVQP